MMKKAQLYKVLPEIRAQCREYSLSSVTLGGGVEGGQLHIVKVLWAHVM